MTIRLGVLLIAAALLLLAGAAYTQHGTMLHYVLAAAGIVCLCLGAFGVLKARRAMPS